MEMTWDHVTAERAEVAARPLPREPDPGAGRRFEQAERVAREVKTYRQRCLVWLRFFLGCEGSKGADEDLRSRELRVLGFDEWAIQAANMLVWNQPENLPEYARRVVERKDADVLAVAIAVIEDEIREGAEGQRDTLAAYEAAREVLSRAADAQRPGDFPAGGVADNLPTAPDLRDGLRALAGSADGAQNALLRMTRGPNNQPWAILGRLSKDDTVCLIVAVHSLMQVVTALVVDVTARSNENTYADRATILASRTQGVNLLQAMETMARTVDRRLRSYNEEYGGDDSGKGGVH